MLYAIGDSETFFYEAKKRATGLNIYAVARRPDGTKVSYSPLAEVDAGTDPITRGVYQVIIPFNQDGKWLILFDSLDAGQQRPMSTTIIVNTVLKNQILKVNSAPEIDTELSANHGSGPWDSLQTLPEVESTFSSFTPSGQ